MSNNATKHYLLVFSRLAGVGCQFTNFNFAKRFKDAEKEEHGS